MEYGIGTEILRERSFQGGNEASGWYQRAASPVKGTPEEFSFLSRWIRSIFGPASARAPRGVSGPGDAR
jgi:hypothetical protein